MQSSSAIFLPLAVTIVIITRRELAHEPINYNCPSMELKIDLFLYNFESLFDEIESSRIESLNKVVKNN